VLASAAGTTVGGAISYLIGQRRPDRDAVERLPLVRPAMVTAADAWLAEDGPRGVWRQPASGIPMKVFARVGGMRGLPPERLLLWAVAARGTRFVVAAGGAALIGRIFRLQVTRWYWPLTLLWTLVFGVGLWRAVLFWERRADAADRHDEPPDRVS
jgi:hypothetical protein